MRNHYTDEEAVAILTQHPDRLAKLLEDVSSPCEYPYCRRRVLAWDRVTLDGFGVYCCRLHALADKALLSPERVA